MDRLMMMFLIWGASCGVFALLGLLEKIPMVDKLAEEMVKRIERR